MGAGPDSSVSRRDLRQLRSKRVGSSSPTSTPRRTSRHRLASGKRLRPSRRSAQRRRRPADGDPPRPRCGLAQREHGRHLQRLPRRASPPTQGRPLRPPHRAPGDANSLANLHRSLLHHRPQRQRHGDCRQTVMPPGSHATWHDQDQRPTPQAAVATTPHQGLGRCRVSVRRPKDLAVTPPMPVQAQAAPGRPAGTLTPRTPPRAGGLDGRGLRQPPLDVEPGVNDE
jgi:hypothetical protein